MLSPTGKPPTAATLEKARRMVFKIEGDYMVAYDKNTGKRMG